MIDILDWFLTERGVPQDSIWSPFIFLLYTAELIKEVTIQNNLFSSQILPTDSKYDDDVKFWRAQTDIYQVLIYIQIAIINLQNWCSKWQI